MPKIWLTLALIIVWASSSCFGQAERADGDLIRVKPSFHEAAYAPGTRPSVSRPVTPSGPSPREQMYVFWILGKMLSYPIDKVESYVRAKLQRPPIKPAAAPATAPAVSSPFRSLDMREIPPAPPVSRNHAPD